MNLLKKFIFSWVIFALLDPDPEAGSGAIDLVESGSRSGFETTIFFNFSSYFRGHGGGPAAEGEGPHPGCRAGQGQTTP